MNGKPRFTALLIGSSEFEESDAFFPLPGVENDLQNMRKLLEEYGFEVESLLNEKKKQILQKIESFGGQVFETFVLYVSTHGTTKKSTGYLLPFDTRAQLKNKSVVADTAISSKELMERLAGIKAKRILLLLDTCHSGGFFNLKNTKARDTLGEPLINGLNSFIGQAMPGRGLAVIAAARNGEAAICEDDGSVFTTRFIETFRGIPKQQIMLFTLVKRLQKSMENEAHIPVFKCDNITEVYAWLIAANPNLVQNNNNSQEQGDQTNPGTPTAGTNTTLKRKRSEGEATDHTRKKSKTKACSHEKTKTWKTSLTNDRNPGKFYRKCLACDEFLGFICPDLSGRKSQLKVICKDMKLLKGGTKTQLQNRIRSAYENPM